MKKALLSVLALSLLGPGSATAQSPAPVPLTPRMSLERSLGVGDRHEYTVTLAEGEAIVGEADQHGVDLVIDEFDPDGKLLTTVDSPNGTEGPEPIDLTAVKAGQYRLVIRPNEDTMATLSALGRPLVGKYVMKIDRILSLADNGRRLAEKNYPPAIQAVWLAYQTDAQAVEKFIESRRGKGPIIEPTPGNPRECNVTYLFLGDANTSAVHMYAGARNGLDGVDLTRFLHTALFYWQESVPRDARYSYQFWETKTWFLGSGGKVQVNHDKLRTTDKLNPNVFNGLSVLTLPDAPAQPYVTVVPANPKGSLRPATLKSASLKEDRRLTIYTPPGYDGKQECDLLVVFDGVTFGSGSRPNVPTPTILDNLIAAHKIGPTVAVLVDNMGKRDRDLTDYPPFADFVGTELIPWARQKYRIRKGGDHVVVAGSSFGGLCSSYCAFRHPEAIGNVLSQSGSYWLRADWEKPPFDWPVTEDSGDLIALFKQSKRLPIKFYVEVGRFDGLGDQLGTNRELRDVLQLKGYPLTYREFDGGHDYIWWRGSFADGLIALIGKDSTQDHRQVTGSLPPNASHL